MNELVFNDLTFKGEGYFCNSSMCLPAEGMSMPPSILVSSAIFSSVLPFMKIHIAIPQSTTQAANVTCPAQAHSTASLT